MENLFAVVSGAGLYFLFSSMVWATNKRQILTSWLIFLVLLVLRYFNLYSSEYVELTHFTAFHTFPFGLLSVLIVNSLISDRLDTNSRLILLSVLLLVAIPVGKWLVQGDTTNIGSSILSSIGSGSMVLLVCFIVFTNTKAKLVSSWVFVLLLAVVPVVLLSAASFIDLDNAALGYALMLGATVSPLIFYLPLLLLITFCWRRLDHGGRTTVLLIAFVIPFLTGVSPFLPYFSFAAATVESNKKTQRAAPQAKGPECRYDGLSLPDNTVVYAAGGRHYNTVDFQVDASGSDARLYQVTVNNKSAPVVLVLSEYNPSVWDISWTEGTRIAALLVSGYHGQVVAGLPTDTPILTSTQDNKGQCGYFYLSQKNDYRMHSLPHRLFGRGIESTFESDQEGQILIGAPLSDSDTLINSLDTTVDSYRQSGPPPGGKRGLDLAVGKGTLRPATKADVARWIDLKEADLVSKLTNYVRGKQDYPKPYLFNSFVVLEDFTFPAGLYGAQSALFFIEQGVAYPTGDPGHSNIFDFNTLECTGSC